ncbi:hypothetical protein N0V95_006200 [Ascochyta clinopodiicola]|nr:hypothetical protein N0V95_006200 [Ascochyta clinopodiicola]
MASSNRYALLDQTALKTVSKLRSLPAQESVEEMVVALEAQDEADGVQDAEWIAEKTAGRSLSWADECQAEAEGRAAAGDGAEVEGDWEVVDGCEDMTAVPSSAREDYEGKQAASLDTTATEIKDDADATSHITYSATIPTTTTRAPFPEWDDYIASMPVFSAPSPQFAPAPNQPQYIVDPSWSVSPSVRPPNPASAASSNTDESKTTMDTELEVAVVQEKKEEQEEQKTTISSTAEGVEAPAVTADDTPVAPSKSRKRRVRKAIKKAAAQKKEVVTVVESTDIIEHPATNLSPAVEEGQATSTKPIKADESARVSPISVAESAVIVTPIVEELQDPTTLINGKTAPFGEDAKLSVAATKLKVENLGDAESLQDGDENLEDVFFDSMTDGSTPAVSVEKSQPSSNTLQEAPQEPVIQIENATISTSGVKASSGHAKDISPKPEVLRKKKNRAKKQRKAAKEAADAATGNSGVAGPTPDEDVMVGNQQFGAEDQKNHDDKVSTNALQKKKPSGALRRKANKAAIARPVGLQVATFFVPWYLALALLMAQLLVLVVGIHLLL